MGKGPRHVTVRDAVRDTVKSQWPIVTVFLIFVVAFGLVITDYWRRGSLLIGIGVGVAAVLRLVLSDHRAGLLVVRGRTMDFTTMATVCAAMLYIAWTIDPLGTG
jgi:phosphate starvation-inducible membrane PsiE